MLNRLAAVPARTSDAIVAHTIETLATNSNDVPLAILYELEQNAGATALRLRGHSGLTEGHRLLIDLADLDSSEGLIPDLRHAGSKAVFIDPDDRFESISWKGWGVPSKKIAILPIMSSECVFGYLVIGTNPYRPFDDSCRQFARDLNRTVSTIVSAAITFEISESRREQLESDLEFSNLRLRHLVEHASVGMCHISVDGHMLWANDRYYDLAGSDAKQHISDYSFYDAYLDEDRPKVEEAWTDLVAGKVRNNVELRLKRTYIPPEGEEMPATIQLLGFPYRDPESREIKSVMACTTDISRLKWAETFHARSAAEARDAKKQQEAFIDVVSHEMRNPLGAIVHCADAIVAMVEDFKGAGVSAEHLALINENAQNANVILQCAKHQRRILDDVLTLSKLDTMLLSITPVPVQLPHVITSVVGMFAAELGSNSIRCDANADASLSDLSIDHVYLDPSRITQIFIKLLSNAIKFVKSSKRPMITIRFGACTSNPRSFFNKNMFWADSEPYDDVTNSQEWGSGENVYLTFTVQDSGIGLDHDQVAKIFRRFSQADIKTHVTYGGSGLGLYISKQLAEKQGGEIGVTSMPGEGSTFGFYVKARRSEKQVLRTTPQTNEGERQMSHPQQLRVLLVEDNLINQQVLSKQLRRGGFIVTVANHGLEALEILEKSTFDVVLMDCEVRNMFLYQTPCMR